jgi:hypothetical protein
MIVLIILAVLSVAAFAALAIWTRRSERDIDYTPTHDADERLQNSTKAATTTTVGFITGSQ